MAPVDYLVIDRETDAVLSIENDELPVDTDEVWHWELFAGEPVPAVGEIFDHECLEFYDPEDPPAIPPGEVVPNYPPRGVPPVPGTPTYPPIDPGRGPAVPALILPDLIPLHADASGPLTMVAPSARTVVVRAKQPYDTTHTCCIAVGGDREIALAGVKAIGVYSLDGVTDWLPLRPGETPAEDGPQLDLGTTGPEVGCFVTPTPSGLLWLGVALEGGDDIEEIDLSSLSLLAYNRTTDTAPCPECPACGAPCCEVAFTASREALWQDDYTGHADQAALEDAYTPLDEPSLLSPDCPGVVSTATSSEMQRCYYNDSVTGYSVPRVDDFPSGITHLWVRRVVQWAPDAPLPDEDNFASWGGLAFFIVPDMAAGRAFALWGSNVNLRDHPLTVTTLTLNDLAWADFATDCPEMVLHFAIVADGGDHWLEVEGWVNGALIHHLRYNSALTGTQFDGVVITAGVSGATNLAEYFTERLVEVVLNGDTNPFAA